MTDRQKLKDKYGDEQVLVVPLDIVRTLGLDSKEYNEKPTDEMIADLEVLEKSAYFIPRYESDNNPNEVEIIGYTAFGCMGSFFTYKRIKNGDARGDGRLSIGVGGHINPVDASEDGNSIILMSSYREIEEEMGFDDIKRVGLIPIAFIRCKATPYDLDHLGIFMQPACEATITDVAEKDKMLPVGMVTKRALTQLYYDELENWTKIIVDNCGGEEEHGTKK